MTKEKEMKKNLLVFLMLVVASVFGAKAQTALVATLNHGGKISAFYGSNAFVEAYEVAEDGDVITLSSGAFAAPDIKKSITVRGAGMFANMENKTEPTYFMNGVNFAGSPKIEGVCGKTLIAQHAENAIITKCKFDRISTNNTGDNGATFIQCIASQVNFENTQPYMEFSNCLLGYVHHTFGTGVCNYKNCTIVYTTDYSISNITHSNLTNCIIIARNNTTTGDYIPSSSRATNCLIANSKSSAPFGSSEEQNWVVTDIKSIMPAFSTDNFSPENFKLTSAATSQYLGTDGTQIGMYGGSLPFDPEPSTPHITNLSVSSKSTSSGTISVGLRVNSGK